jgi:hypothetical protein
MKHLTLLLIFLILGRPHLFGAGDYAIEELRDEDAATLPPFSISRVVAFDGGLRLFLTTASPDAIANLLAAGALETQLSDHEAETASTVSLTLGKAVWCTEDGEPVFMSYLDPTPLCEGAPPARLEYFFESTVTLGPGRALAIGQDPDFLWLIEER